MCGPILSTFDLGATKDFYAKVFGWQYHDEDGYQFAYTGNKQSAGIYIMPEKFQQMGMPSFWMSYISVTNIHDVVAQAKQMGGKVEIEPTDFGEQGQIALIRDPSGAGFTVWNGPDFDGKDGDGTHGRMVWNELYVSDASLVLDFYRTVFGWSFTVDRAYDGERYDIRNGDGIQIAVLEVMPNEIKGKEEFWAPYFAVTDLAATLALIAQEGGQVLDKIASDSGNLALVMDPQKATFALMENQTTARSSGKETRMEKSSPTVSDGSISGFKWRALLALVLIYIAVLFDLQWVWGLLFLSWLIPDIISGEIHLVEQVRRDRNPIVYWLTIGTWFWMSVYLLLTPFWA